MGEGSSEKNCCHRIVTCSLLKCTGLNSFELALIHSTDLWTYGLSKRYSCLSVSQVEKNGSWLLRYWA